MGRKKGDTVEVAAPRGALKFKILEIEGPRSPGSAPGRVAAGCVAAGPAR